jgi:hypothetical protein
MTAHGYGRGLDLKNQFRLIEIRNHAMGRRVRSSRLATRDFAFRESCESILRQDLSASIDEGIKLVTVE